MTARASWWVRDLRGIDPHTRVVLYAIAAHTNGSESAWPSVAEIAASSGLGKTTVRAVVGKLAGLGVAVERSKGRRPNRYTFPQPNGRAMGYDPPNASPTADGLAESQRIAESPQRIGFEASTHRRPRSNRSAKDGRLQEGCEPARVGDILAAAASPPDGGDGRSGLSQKHPAECRCNGDGVLLIRGDGPTYQVACPGEPF